jgi:hypothetical protein
MLQPPLAYCRTPFGLNLAAGLAAANGERNQRQAGGHGGHQNRHQAPPWTAWQKSVVECCQDSAAKSEMCVDMSSQPFIEIPAGYQRAIRFGANWTLATSPYLPLSFVASLALGGMPIARGEIGPALEIAGKSPVVFGAIVMLDAVFHALFFVSAVTLFAVLRQRWPVRASLILTGGAWQMIIGLTKGLSSAFTFTRLGAAYVVGDSAVKTLLLPVASGEYGLRLALQAMDGCGVMVVWLIISLFPSGIGLPRLVRWVGWLLILALLIATPAGGPTFLLVVLLFPVWLFLIGRWLQRQLPAK